MSLFNSKNSAKKPASSQAALAEIALKNIQEGVVMIDVKGIIRFVNPAAVTMLECDSASKAIDLDYGLIIRLESKEGRELPERENPLVQAINTRQPLEKAQVALICLRSNKRIPIAISVHPIDDGSGNFIVTFRDITRELEEEGEQTEFISTASHEMRTPVATIDGYLSLALNPKTATLDERARGYLTSAQIASKHLGKLFQDLLDITKLDDGKIRPHFVPVEMIETIKTISDDYIERARQNKIAFSFGSNQKMSFDSNRRLSQVVYGFIDMDFMREIMDNLIENAIKYTPEGGSIYISVLGDGDRVLINVTDTGIGISADDLGHIFQKFYHADNSDTREIGGTGLGLYLVKQRVEAMGGRVWAESAFGEGSTFYVSLPRITTAEYEKRMIAVNNQATMQKIQQTSAQEQPQPQVPSTPPASSTPNSATPTQPTPTPTPTPVSSPTPTPVSSPTPTPAPVVSPTPTPPPAPASVNSTPQSITRSQAPSTPTPTPSVSPSPAPSTQPTSNISQAPKPVIPTTPPAPIPPPTPPTTPSPTSQNNINNLNGEAK